MEKDAAEIKKALATGALKEIQTSPGEYREYSRSQNPQSSPFCSTTNSMLLSRFHLNDCCEQSTHYVHACIVAP